MGCAESTPVVAKAPPEPVPSLDVLRKTRVEHIPGEPRLAKGKHDLTQDEALELIIRQVGHTNKGNQFILEQDDKVWNRMIIDPARPDLVNVRKRLEKMMYVHRETDRLPIAFAVKNVPKGMEHYLLLSPTPVRETQKQPTSFIGPKGYEDTYPFASIEFRLDTTVCEIKVTGQSRADPPLYTMRQCNPKVWVVKKQDVVCAAIQQVQNIAKLTGFRVCYCAGTDPLMMSLLVAVIDDFLDTAKTQFWQFHPKGAPLNMVFPA